MTSVTSESSTRPIYSSYSNPPEFFNMFSILKKPSSPSSPKSVSFASNSSEYASYEHRLHAEQQAEKARLAEEARQAEIKQQERFGQRVAQAIKNAFEEARIEADQQAKEARLAKEHAERVEQQAKQARLAQAARLAEERRLAQQANEARLAEQARIEKARAEETRLAKERADRLAQQQAEAARLAEEACRAEEARLAKERAELLQQQQAEEARIAKERAEAFACRRCSARFPSNTKLHNHVQDHHQKKPQSEIAIPTPPSTSKAVVAERTAIASTAVLTPPATPTPKPSLSATSKKPISWAEIASRPVIAPKPSRLPIPTPKSVPKARETPSDTCPPTPQTPNPKHQKPYLTIDDLFEMFAEKPAKSGRLRTKKGSSSPKLSYQAKITSYFRPAANQSKPISQGSKTPNPRSLQQHTPAESNRVKSLPSKTISEKPVILPYKLAVISGLKPRTKPAKSSTFTPPSSTPRASLNISGSCHACRICSGTFRSNNGLLVTYEPSISAKRLAFIWRSPLESTVAISAVSEIPDAGAGKQAHFLLLSMYY